MSELNGTAVNRIKVAKGKKPSPKQGRKPLLAVSRLRRPITIGLGCAIPLASLFLSSHGGTCLQGGAVALGSASLILCGVILTVSLSHLAGAIQDITGSDKRQSWAMAIAVDAGLVMCELSIVHGHGGFTVGLFMVAVTAVSAVLNCWAFLRHK